MWIEEISTKKRDEEKNVNKGEEENNMNEENKKKKCRWMCVDEKDECGWGVNINERYECENIYEWERRR